MIVRYQGNNATALTAGADYVVITKNVSSFRVVDDAGQSSDYPRDEFAIIDDLPTHEVFSNLAQLDSAPESRRQLEAAYERVLERVRCRRPDLQLPTRPGLVLPIEILGGQRRLVGFGNDPRITRAAAAYRWLVELGDLVIAQIGDLLDGGTGPARVYAACALAELRGDRAPFRRLAGDNAPVLFVRPGSCTVEPVSVSDCGRRLRRIEPTLWDI